MGVGGRVGGVSDSQCPQTGSSSEWVVKATDARGAGISTG
jgi:hypothetical protein